MFAANRGDVVGDVPDAGGLVQRNVSEVIGLGTDSGETGNVESGDGAGDLGIKRPRDDFVAGNRTVLDNAGAVPGEAQLVDSRRIEDASIAEADTPRRLRPEGPCGGRFGESALLRSNEPLSRE